MKKFFAAIVMVCLIGAFSNQAMAQGPRRDNGRPGPAPAAVHQPAPAHHVNAVPAPHHAKPVPPPPAPHHAKPLPPPPPQHHAKPVPPPPHHAKPLPPPPHHARPLPPPEPAPAPRPIIDYRPGVGLYIGGEHFGFTISL